MLFKIRTTITVSSFDFKRNIQVNMVLSSMIDRNYFWVIATLVGVIDRSIYNKENRVSTLVWEEEKGNWWPFVNWQFIKQTIIINFIATFTNNALLM